jgi:broad specificity phosphatase PhoE
VDSATSSSRNNGNGKAVLTKQVPTIFMVRHGDTKLNSGHNSPEKFRGHKDVPLSEEGIQEGKDTAEDLSKYPIREVYSSDLSRAADTAQMIADAQDGDCEVEIDEALRPWDLGELTAKPVKDGLPLLKQYAQTPNKAIPGGESLNTFKERYLTKLDEIMEEVEQEGGMVAVVTHTRDMQITKASYAVPGKFNNHNIDLKVFDDYSDELSTGEFMRIEFKHGEWVLNKKERGGAVRTGKSSSAPQLEGSERT